MTLSPTSWPGGGSGVGPSCVLATSAAQDIHAVGDHKPLWNRILDNPYDANILSALPTGLGLSNPADGSTNNVTVTAAGVWVFTFLTVFQSGTDAGIRGLLTETFVGASVPFGPITVAGIELVLTVAYALTAGASADFNVSTTTIATAGTYNARSQLCITRLV